MECKIVEHILKVYSFHFISINIFACFSWHCSENKLYLYKTICYFQACHFKTVNFKLKSINVGLEFHCDFSRNKIFEKNAWLMVTLSISIIFVWYVYAYLCINISL